jgi:hypothetical protein
MAGSGGHAECVVRAQAGLSPPDPVVTVAFDPVRELVWAVTGGSGCLAAFHHPSGALHARGPAAHAGEPVPSAVPTGALVLVPTTSGLQILSPGCAPLSSARVRPCCALRPFTAPVLWTLARRALPLLSLLSCGLLLPGNRSRS